MLARLLLAVVGLGVAQAAPADTPVPNPNCSDVPCSIALVGTSGGVPDPAGAFEIQVLAGLGCNPVPGSTVVIDFQDCVPDIRICSVQSGSVNTLCGPPRIQAVTNAIGVARFTIVGAADNASGAAPGYSGPTFCSHAGTIACAKVYADGVLLRTIGVTAYDQNLTGGVNPADISAWLADAFSGTYFGRSDYDASASLAPPDLSKLLGVALGAGSTTSCTAYCQ